MAAPSRPGAPGLLLCLLGGAIAAAWGSAPPAPQICSGCCAGSVRNGSAVAGFCGARAGAGLLGRCCLERAAVVGLDLGNCSLSQLCPSFREASTAIVIDLTVNQLEPPPEDAFRGFTQLQTLALPVELDCPGGSNMWDNITTQGHIRICQGQRNPCNGSGGLGWLCPEDSLCAPDGPGLPQCLCVGPYHGYKCLRQGTFPYLLFYGTLGAVTIGLSILLWVTQRRKVKAS
ncbi:all-trans retinoic acid-induced differentiation factor [Eublepharis macularius]|uniref:All-trans retinoic acid-induced differentiation factor n=1 Tax=Eublepharis macularius TaxID=481883 RepID=A0AA97KFS2_EUBMA|nr:all-trans retinoic acid-induced differentiation factor [Eublepharis macularius]